MSGDFYKDFSSYLYIGEVLVQRGTIPELERILCHRGGGIHHAGSSAEARAFIENCRISAVLIDQYLAHCSGVELMRWLQGFAPIPAIIILGQAPGDQETETVVALEAGAADAVREDIGTRELAARVRASIRKYFQGSPDLHPERPEQAAAVATRSKQPLYFNGESRRVYFSDATRVVLNSKEADLLALLVEHHPDYLDRETISQHLFQHSWNPHDRRIDNLISRLRRVLDAWDTDSSESAIETVRNEGYRLRAPIVPIHMDQASLLVFPLAADRNFTA